MSLLKFVSQERVSEIGILNVEGGFHILDVHMR